MKSIQARSKETRSNGIDNMKNIVLYTLFPVSPAIPALISSTERDLIGNILNSLHRVTSWLLPYVNSSKSMEIDWGRINTL